MRWGTRLATALGTAVVVVAGVAAPTAATEPAVTLVVGTDGPGAALALAELGADVVDASADLGAVTIEVPAARAAFVAARLDAAPGIGFVEPDHVFRAQRTPSDTYWHNQWGARTIGAPAAWDVTTGATSTVIAVLDTGVDPGPEFDGKLTAGYDFVNGDTDPDDDNGHGTAVAAIAAADANDGGVAGICWTCRVMPVKVLGADGSGSSYDIARGITWAAERGADAIVLSLGSPSASSVVATAVAQARAAGAVVVAAAGNAGNTTPNYPAATDGVIGVAASDQADARYSFSNHGGWVDVAAPGCNGRRGRGRPRPVARRHRGPGRAGARLDGVPTGRRLGRRRAGRRRCPRPGGPGGADHAGDRHRRRGRHDRGHRDDRQHRDHRWRHRPDRRRHRRPGAELDRRRPGRRRRPHRHLARHRPARPPRRRRHGGGRPGRRVRGRPRRRPPRRFARGTGAAHRP
jgi:hypothetical protein